MLSNSGFDLWADGYDKCVAASDDDNSYPFAGYKNVLNSIYNITREKVSAKILDIGFGTGILTKKLYDDGYIIYGIDFSDRMLQIGSEKMPFANLIRHDFAQGFPRDFDKRKFDYIISTYALHHLTDQNKYAFIKEAANHLKPDGSIIIGDIAFETRALLEQCRTQSREAWDEDEFYFVFDELNNAMPKLQLEFTKVTFCSGIIIIKK